MRDVTRDRIQFLRAVARDYGDIASIRLWHLPFVLLARADLVQSVLVEQADAFDKAPPLPLVGEVVGNGVFSVLARNGAHQKRRRLLQPAFAPRRSSDYVPTMIEYSNRLIAEWRDGEEIEMWHEMARLTLGIAGRAFFGVDLWEDSLEIARGMDELFVLFGEELKAPFPLPLWIPTPHARRVKQSAATLHRAVESLIADRRESGEDRGDFLSSLFALRHENGEPLSEREMRDEALTMLIAGHETTASALTWMFYELARQPEKMERAREEAQRVLDQRDATLEDLGKMPFALQIWKETLRLHPSADTMSLRVALRNVEIDGFTIRKGTPIIISPDVLHQRNEVFANALEWRPERFTPQAEKALPRFSYLPFGGGARVCIGQHFATVEAQVVLSTLLRRVRFENINTDVQSQAVFTTRPDRPVRLKIYKH